MQNVYALKPGRVIKVIQENPITKTLYFKLKNQDEFKFLAGQFLMVGLPGFGECPIAISSNPKNAKKHFSLTIQAVGDLTAKLISLKKGDVAYARGPFGNGFPEVNKNLILIGGGCGFVPLKAAYEENKNRKDIKIQIFWGCREEGSLVFKKDFEKIKRKHDFRLILESGTLKGISKGEGFVTNLIKKGKLLKNAVVFVCGPEKMYKFVVKELLAKNVALSGIYLSMERRMHCGVAVCQHCAIGTKYVCKDGPVFSYEYLQDIAGLKGT